MTVTDKRRVRGQRNRQALIDAALTLITVQGYDATTVDQIASAAGVAPRTFFHHFAAKEDIFFDGYAERLGEATRRFRASQSRTLWGALAEAADAVGRAIAEAPDLFLVRARMYQEVPALRASMLRINEDWIDQLSEEVGRRLDADPRRDLRPRLAATLVNGANRAAIDVWVAYDGRSDIVAGIGESIGYLRPAIDELERCAPTEDGRRCG
ncbi:TetR family transcriptional regulator [Mycolicibacterium sp. 018/SC-01/001]|uniref:TetR/AcrR family transcriptional regulator n=1 Tax=Mycolicibacterium sp. 018/SC-01/001 TaxID=2592069 RepID=UPI00117BEF6B|nr:TetR/AcrR family transcriptional regulator [Mycolicibacterium sp. 018/SC-01/001]TRW79634.1 TetR family transcriptional regulator [Mycolicibacterium sp. 018/SC-01/001]